MSCFDCILNNLLVEYAEETGLSVCLVRLNGPTVKKK
jgi:hypothetical protein